MAREHNARSALVRFFVDGVWTSAAVVSVTDWLLGHGGAKERELTNPDVRFEPSDVNSRAVVLTGIGILVGMHLIIGLLYFFFEHLVHEYAQKSPPPLPVAAATLHGVYLPPEPRLQQDPPRDLREFIITEESELHGYRWVDRQAGTVAIPIDRAMDLLLQRGIPPQKAPPNLFYQPHAGSRMTGLEGKVEPLPQ